MNCNCCSNLIIPTSITTTSGVTTITIPSTTFNDKQLCCLGLFTTIPIGTGGTQINITDGSSTWTVYNRFANYWRPCTALRSRSILKLRYLNAPEHFIIVNGCRS